MSVRKWISLVLLLGSVQAHGITVDFDLLNPVSSTGKQGKFADSHSYSSEGVGMTVSGLSSGGDKYNPFASISESHLSLTGGGLGVERRGGARGAVDNRGLDFDFLLLEFDSEVSLSSVGLGFVPRYADTDVSIGGVDEFGVWSVGNIYDAEMGSNDVNTSFSASTWLIGAFHPSFGIAQDFSWDAFRIDQISVNISAVPLPATVWFFGTGLAFLAFLRRRSQQA